MHTHSRCFRRYIRCFRHHIRCFLRYIRCFLCLVGCSKHHIRCLNPHMWWIRLYIRCLFRYTWCYHHHIRWLFRPVLFHCIRRILLYVRCIFRDNRCFCCCQFGACFIIFGTFCSMVFPALSKYIWSSNLLQGTCSQLNCNTGISVVGKHASYMSYTH